MKVFTFGEAANDPLLCVNQIAANFVNERVPRGNNAIIRHVKLKKHRNFVL